MKKWAVALDGKCFPAAQCSRWGLGGALRGSSHLSAAVPTVSLWRSWWASWNKGWHFPKRYLLLVTPQERSCAHLTFLGTMKRLTWKPLAAAHLSSSQMMMMGPSSPGDTTVLGTSEPPFVTAAFLLSCHGSRASAAGRHRLPEQPYGSRPGVVPLVHPSFL